MGDEDGSDDDAPPVAISLGASRAAAQARDASVRSTQQSIRQAQKAVERKQSATITAHARGDDSLLPDDILNQLPPTAMPMASSSGGNNADEGEDMYSRALAKKQAKARAKAEAAAAKASKPDGLPKVVARSGTVEVAVLPMEDENAAAAAATAAASSSSFAFASSASASYAASRGGGGGGGHRRPATQSALEFMNEQLYGSGRVKRVPAATLDSLKATGGRFGAASNFATVPAPLQSDIDKERKERQKKKARQQQPKQMGGKGGFTSLEKMAAQIMRRGKQGGKK